ncbi:hypothetical protein PhaeoP128_00343 [Phaeobacter gallaeciensis]|nr:hypothetical protein PhaeoP129_00343 [Phaeobacter gallaeciensis]ATF21119.1 hypothetical protein PhaeoP128_00343 [Phaeobacter gallaeciensis]
MYPPKFFKTYKDLDRPSIGPGAAKQRKYLIRQYTVARFPKTGAFGVWP